ncbi:hypothetical protein F25303_2204 [Fusarium sp. NRRL 25303]|nr:hypothetical protein F25303_2204 [Fusarium sp. NRRL 25303]
MPKWNIPPSDSRMSLSITNDVSTILSIPIAGLKYLSTTSITAAESRRDGENAFAETAVDLTGAVAAGGAFAVTVVGEGVDNTMAASLVTRAAEDGVAEFVDGEFCSVCRTSLKL